jgi:hypothetical protein
VVVITAASAVGVVKMVVAEVRMVVRQQRRWR